MNDELKKADEITRNLRECEHIGYETQRQMDLAAADLIDALQAQLVDYPHLEKVVDGQMSQNRKLRKINEALTAENAELREAIANASKLIATMRNNKKAALWLRKYQLPAPPQKGMD